MTYEEFFAKAKEKAITNIQITEEEHLVSSVGIIDGKLESYDDSNNTNYRIKAEYKDKTVKLKTNYLAEDIIDLLIFKSKSTDTNYEDEYLEKTVNIEKNKPLKVDISKEIKELKELDSLRKDNKNINKLATYFTEEWENTRIINSNGVDISSDAHYCDFCVDVITKNSVDVISFDRRVLTTDKKDINFTKFTQDVIDKSIILKDREKLENRKYNIILDNYTAGKIIFHLLFMLSAANIRNKASCLENKLNKKVFNEKLTIVEEPTNKKYPGYRLFDDEGTKTKDKLIIENGKVKTYLYNIKEAKIKDINSTGNGYNGISVRNMHIKPGKKNLDELLKELDNGIYITDYMGSQGTAINSINGQISIQIFGFIVENGKIVKGFEPAIMTTTIFELLSNIKEIGNDLVFNNISSASPSLLIEDISISS